MASSIPEESGTESLPIPKLMQVIESSLREYENGQTKTKIELEKLKKERDLSNQEVVSLKNSQGLMQLEMLKLRDELRKCEELNKGNKVRMEEQKNQEKRLKELYEKVCNENSQMTIESSKLTSDIEKNKQLVGEYKEKSDLLCTRLEETVAEKSKLEEKLRKSELNCKEQSVRIMGLIEEEKNLKKRREYLYKEKLRVIQENATNKQKIRELEQQLEKYQSLNGRVEKLEKEIDGMVHEKLAAQTKEIGEKRFDGGCEGQDGSATGSKRKISSVLSRGGGSSGAAVGGMLSSPSASQGIIQVCENDDATNLRIKNGTTSSCLLHCNQKTKPFRAGEAKRRNICRSAEGKFPTGEKPSLNLQDDSILRPISRQSRTTFASTRGAEKAKPSGIIYADPIPIDLEDDSCSSSYMNEIIDNLRGKNCRGN